MAQKKKRKKAGTAPGQGRRRAVAAQHARLTDISAHTARHALAHSRCCALCLAPYARAAASLALLRGKLAQRLYHRQRASLLAARTQTRMLLRQRRLYCLYHHLSAPACLPPYHLQHMMGLIHCSSSALAIASLLPPPLLCRSLFLALCTATFHLLYYINIYHYIPIPSVLCLRLLTLTTYLHLLYLPACTLPATLPLLEDLGDTCHTLFSACCSAYYWDSGIGYAPS